VLVVGLLKCLGARISHSGQCRFPEEDRRSTEVSRKLLFGQMTKTFPRHRQPPAGTAAGRPGPRSVLRQVSTHKCLIRKPTNFGCINYSASHLRLWIGGFFK
jgi:hypothetical protein